MKLSAPGKQWKVAKDLIARTVIVLIPTFDVKAMSLLIGELVQSQGIFIDAIWKSQGESALGLGTHKGDVMANADAAFKLIADYNKTPEDSSK